MKLWGQDRTLLKSHSRHQAGGASHRRTRRAETEGGVGSSVPTGPCAPAVPRPGSVLQPINPPPPIRLDSLLLAIQPILNNQRKWSRSVMSDSLQPHGLQPTRLLHPWSFLGKSTGVGCHFLLQGIFPTWGSNPSLLHCRQTLYHLSQQGAQHKGKWNLTHISLKRNICS